MNYLFAFIVLMGVGLGVNFIMLRLYKKKLISDGQRSGDDLLECEAKEAIAKDIEELRTVITELTSGLREHYRQLEHKQAHVETLIAKADEKIALLNDLCLPKSPCVNASEAAQHNETSQIQLLHRQGLDTTEIARSLGVGVGEVELRIGLMNKLR